MSSHNLTAAPLLPAVFTISKWVRKGKGWANICNVSKLPKATQNEYLHTRSTSSLLTQCSHQTQEMICCNRWLNTENHCASSTRVSKGTGSCQSSKVLSTSKVPDIYRTCVPQSPSNSKRVGYPVHCRSGRRYHRHALSQKLFPKWSPNSRIQKTLSCSTGGNEEYQELVVCPSPILGIMMWLFENRRTSVVIHFSVSSVTAQNYQQSWRSLECPRTMIVGLWKVKWCSNNAGRIKSYEEWRTTAALTLLGLD